MDSLKNMIVANGRIHEVFRPSKIDLSLNYATFTTNGAKLIFGKFLRRKPVTKKPLLFERNGLFIAALAKINHRLSRWNKKSSR